MFSFFSSGASGGASNAVNSRGVKEPYTYVTYGGMRDFARALARDYPDYVEVYDALERHGLPQPPGRCPLDDEVRGAGKVDCEVVVVRVTHKASLEAASGRRPQVFLSGALHGDERIGPISALETARLVVRAAHCAEAPGGPAAYASCDQLSPLEKAALDFDGRGAERAAWLARLVRRRELVVMPAANALGFALGQRREGTLDPNRDFPYDTDPEACMRTVAGRAVNEVWREHVFQTAVTFHGGMRAVAYEWGAPSYPKSGGGDVSPDEHSQADFAKRLAGYAGSFTALDRSGGRPYPWDRLNDIVYAVRGGMEDWAYAGSWDAKPRTHSCRPKTYGGYPEEKTVYEDATLRAANILVEASDAKWPSESVLGGREGLFEPKGKGSGHVPRNLRLSLLALDAVQPWVAWAGAGGTAAAGQQRPADGAAAAGYGCPAPALATEHDPEGPWVVEALHGDGKATVRWHVGGAVTVDRTRVLWGCLDATAAAPPAIWWCGGASVAKHAGRARHRGAGGGDGGDGGEEGFFLTPEASGAAYWHKPDGKFGDAFTADLDVAERCGAGVGAWAVAEAVVDQSWGKAPAKGHPAGMAPQTHLANARTNAAWDMHAAGSHVVGRVTWHSPPLLLGPDGLAAAAAAVPPPPPARRLAATVRQAANGVAKRPGSVIPRAAGGDVDDRRWAHTAATVAFLLAVAAAAGVVGRRRVRRVVRYWCPAASRSAAGDAFEPYDRDRDAGGSPVGTSSTTRPAWLASRHHSSTTPVRMMGGSGSAGEDECGISL